MIQKLLLRQRKKKKSVQQQGEGRSPQQRGAFGMSWLWIAIIGLSLLGLLLVVLVLVTLVIIHLPAASAPSSATLPNRMQIMQWSAFETKLLFEEIWTGENTYSLHGIRFPEDRRSVVVDCGANIGMFSLFAAAQCRGNAKIVAFEPIESTFDVLRQNAELANKGNFNEVFRPREEGRLEIVPYCCGVSSKNVEKVVFEFHPNLTIWSSGDKKLVSDRKKRIVRDVMRAIDASKSVFTSLIPRKLIQWAVNALIERRFGITVQVMAKLRRLGEVLDECLEENDKVDLLKIDVEGAEVDVLEGVGEKWWKKVMQVVMEVENFATEKKVRHILEKEGFSVISRASEREKNPAVLSEVSMVYATRSNNGI